MGQHFCKHLIWLILYTESICRHLDRSYEEQDIYISAERLDLFNLIQFATANCYVLIYCDLNIIDIRFNDCL